MTWQQAIAQLRRDMQTAVDAAVLRLLVFTLTAASTSLGDQDAVEGYDKGTDPDSGEKSQRTVSRVQPFGFAGRPPKGLRGLTFRFGASNALFLGIAPQNKYGPQDLDVGESALWNVTKALVRMWKSGKVSIASDGDQITIDSGSQDIVLNGGTAKVARVSAGDKTESHDHTVTFSLTAPSGGGAVTGTITVMTHAGLEITSGGADHVKA